MEDIYCSHKLTFFNNKLFLYVKNGVRIIDDKGTSRFINNSFYEGDRLNQLFGLDQPQNRIKALCK